jgi:sugar lactone lactonase YvrE
MIGRWSIVGAAVLAGMLSADGAARAQLPITTFAGRQIGDGRAATAASLNRPYGVAFANDGALLIADRIHHRIRRVDPATSVIATLVGTVAGGGGNGMAADQAEMRDPLRVRHDPATGDLLIAEFEGHVVRRFFAASGNVGGVAGSPATPGATGDAGPAGSALLNGPSDAAFDGAGGILIADRNNHRIRRVDALGTINTVAGTGVPGYDPTPTLAALAQLNSPACVLPIPGGPGYFFCDEGNHVIRRVDPVTGIVTTVAGNGMAGFADGPAAAAAFNTPINLAFADGSNTALVVADSDNNRLRRIDLVAGTVSTIAGTGVREFTADGMPAAGSPIAEPSAVTLAPDGRIVFAEDGAHRVRAIDAAGNLVTLAGDGVARFGGDGGPAVDAQFGQVKSVARDGDGNFLVSDAGNNRLRRVNALSGVVETVAGNGSPAFGGDGGPAVDAGLTISDALEDAAGNIVFSDTDNNRIRRIDPDGVISTIAGTGVPAFGGDAGPAAAASLNHPTGLALDDAGNLFFADFENNVIRRIDTAGIITTVAGVPGPPGFNGDGIPATSAMLANPTDVTVDGAGNLWIADFENHRVRFVDAATGLISTAAGTGVLGNDGDGGPAIAARLNNPSDVNLDETGAVWVTDFGNHRVRRFVPNGNIDAVAGTGLRGWAGDGGDALQARMLFPLRLLVLASDSVLVADRDNFVVRLLGDLAFDCTGEGAATCVPGGGKSGPDCFTEFKLAMELPPGLPSPKLSCVDGNPDCDADAQSGQCTFRIAACVNNEETRFACTPGAVTSIKLTGNLAAGGGGQTLLDGLGALGPSGPLRKGRGVAYTSALADRNRCTPLGDFVVTIKRKKGKGQLGALTTTAASGKDKDKLKLFCLPPS